MRTGKRFIVLGIFSALILSLSIFSASATENLDSQQAEIERQISELDVQIESLNQQTIINEANQILFAGARIVQTEPQFIVEQGFSYESLIGAGPSYCVVENPESGKILLGTYWGMHSKGTLATVQVGGQTVYATIAGPISAESQAVYDELNALKAQREELYNQKKQIEAQRDATIDQFTETLRLYDTNAEDEVIFQLNNPYVLAYGITSMIEEGNMNAYPVAIDNTTLVPIRAVMDAVGGETYWDASSPNYVSLYLSPIEIVLQLNDTTAYVNGEPVTMPVAPQIINGKTMIPLRFVSEEMGMNVEWVPEGSIIRIVYSLDWTQQLDRYIVDQGNGTKQFSNPVQNIRYTIPSECEINLSSYYGEPGAVVTITTPGISGNLRISIDTPSTYVQREQIELTQWQKDNGIKAIYSSPHETSNIYYIDSVFLFEKMLRIDVNAESDSLVSDADQVTGEFAEQIHWEMEKNYAALEEIAVEIINSINGM